MSGCICAICYEDVVPASELLQTISVCGHVFHELCLQQWIEFCPNGRKPTCPLCKQNCGGKDVHRLYFQSSSECFEKQDAFSTNLPPSSDRQSSEADRAEMAKLEAKVRMLSNVCESSKQQVSELEAKEARYSEQLQMLEAERLRAKKEKVQLVESLGRTREELRRSSEQRQELGEHNKAMAKDLAVYQLATDVELTEEDMLRLATVGRGTNKDDIIDMMTKSLHVRNRAFKELMAKCQELGMEESRAQQKSERLMEQLKRLKARVQEMSRIEEEKENAVVRSLASGGKVVERLSPFQTTRGGVGPRNDWAGAPRPNASERVVRLRPLIPLNDGQRMEGNSMSPAIICLDSDANVDDSQVQEGNAGRKTDSVGVVEMGMAAQDRDGEFYRRNWTGSSQQDGGYRRTPGGRGRSPFREETVNSEMWAEDGAMDTDPHGLFVGARMQHLGTSKRVELRGLPSYEGSYQDGRPSGSQNTRPKITIGVDGDIDNMEALGRSTMLPIRHELALGHGVTFSRSHSVTGGLKCSLPATSQAESTFIVTGADGRGGRITVLKPPKLFPGGSSSVLGANRLKRHKPSSVIASSRPAALKIEHFFGRG